MRTTTMLLITATCLVLVLFLAFTFENYINTQYPSCSWCDERYGINGSTQIAWGLTAQDITGLAIILPIASAFIISLLLVLPEPKNKDGF